MFGDHLLHHAADEVVGDGVDALVALDGRIDDAVFLEDRQVLADDRLALAQAGPEVGDAGLALTVDEAEELEADRVSAHLELP